MACNGINRIRLEFKVDRETARKLREKVLIESDWNLKSFTTGHLTSCAESINRIRLEFKAKVSATKVSETKGINRIRLEFKERYLRGIGDRVNLY